MGEQWKPVVGYEGLYEVSDLGRLWSTRRQGSDGRVLALGTRSDGRLSVSLRKGATKATRLVHRLVLTAFAGPCPEGMEACHFPDRNPANNRLSNLRWGTKEDNEADKIAHGTTNRGERHGMAKLNATDVERVRDLSRNGCSQRKIARWFGVNQSTVRDILIGRTWAALGGCTA